MYSYSELQSQVPPVEQDLNPVTKQVVTFITFVTLLLPRAYPATSVVTVSHKVHNWLKLSSIIFLSQQALYLLLIKQKPDNLEEAS